VKGEIWILDLRSHLSDDDNDISDLDISCNSQFVTVAGTVLIFQYPHNITQDKVEVMVFDPDDANATAAFNITLMEDIIPEERELDLFLILFTLILTAILTAVILTIYAFYRGKYEIEEVFLVYSQSSLLISHKYSGDGEMKNRDIMASMFAAVQDFVSDAFNPEDTTKAPLKIMEVGDKKIMVERGDYTYIGVVFRGGNWRLAPKVKSTVAELEARYKKEFEAWDGILDNFKGIDDYLDDLMGSS
jgi:hypothetical protein